MKRAHASPAEGFNGLGKPKSNKKSKKGLHLSGVGTGQMQKGGVPQQSDSAAGLAEDGQGEGYEPYRRDILADVARKQREHLLGGKTGMTAELLHPASHGQSCLALTLLSSFQARAMTLKVSSACGQGHRFTRQLLATGLPLPEVRALSGAGKAGKGTPAAKAAAQEDSGSAPAAAFFKPDSFQGTQAGYVFKAGPQGTGYYLDG